MSGCVLEKVGKWVCLGERKLVSGCVLERDTVCGYVVEEVRDGEWTGHME